MSAGWMTRADVAALLGCHTNVTVSIYGQEADEARRRAARAMDEAMEKEERA